MLPQAKKSDLLYVTDSGYDLIDVYTYPRGNLVGSFHGYGSGYPVSLCVDSSGNVYVTFNYGAIVEYAHGGTEPINSWNNFSSPVGCSVDPTTGNLAVANFENNLSGGKGYVWIWDKATGKGQGYSYRHFSAPYWCGYDDAGNLFIEGYFRRHGRGHLGLVELPSGDTSLKNILISVDGNASGVQYDGEYVTIGSGDNIYQLRISRSRAKVVGTTTLATSSGNPWNYFVVSRGNIQGSRVVATFGSLAGYFNYPGGGGATKIFQLGQPTSAAVSFAKK